GFFEASVRSAALILRQPVFEIHVLAGLESAEIDNYVVALRRGKQKAFGVRQGSRKQAAFRGDECHGERLACRVGKEDLVKPGIRAIQEAKPVSAPLNVCIRLNLAVDDELVAKKS